MTKQSKPPLKRFLAAHGISQADLARGINKTTAFISMLANADCNPAQDTINAILDFLSSSLGYRVSYDDVFLGLSPRGAKAKS